jgi:cytochrome c-type biogenesis protein CcmH/NrfF
VSRSPRSRGALAALATALSVALLLAASPAAARAQQGETVTGAVQTSPGGVGDVPVPGADTVLDRRVQRVAQRLRCPVCQGESIQESPAELAAQMKGVVREQLAAGKSEQEVLNYFLAKYGDWILLEPRAEGINLLVYWVPVIFMVIGGVVLFLTVKKWVKPRPTNGVARDAAAIDAALDEAPVG